MNFEYIEKATQYIDILYIVANEKLVFNKDYNTFTNKCRSLWLLLDKLDYEAIYCGKYDPRVKNMLLVWNGDRGREFLSVEYLRENASCLYSDLHKSCVQCKNKIHSMIGKWTNQQVQDSLCFCDSIDYNWRKRLNQLNEFYELDIRLD